VTSRAADVIAATLAAAGVQKIFGVVGTSTLDLADAIAREPRLEFVSARSEEAGAHMADGYARSTGRVGVVLAHVGPGALRLLYGVGTAWKDHVPMLVLAGNEVLAATDDALRESYHVMDTHALYRPVTKETLQLRTAGESEHVTRRALWTAVSGRPGPVLVDLPKDIVKAPVEAAEPARSDGNEDRVPANRVAANPADVRWSAEAIIRARTPVILAGAGVHWAGAHQSLRALAEARNLPVLTTDGGRGAITEAADHFLGVVGRQAGDSTARELLAEADVVVAVGTPLSDISTFEWSAWSPEATVIHVDISAEVGRRGLIADRQVVADADEFFRSLEVELAAHGYRQAASWLARRDALGQERTSYRQSGRADGQTGLVDPWSLIDELDQVLPEDAFISVDSGMHSFYGKKLRVLEPRSYLRSAGFGAMGYSFPALLGALEGHPERRAVAIVGDGCLAMCLGEFETAARRGSSVTVVVFNDARFASQQSHQHRRFEGRVIGTDFRPTDFAKIAEAQGVPGWTVDDDDAARSAIRTALGLAGPALVDARLNPGIRPPAWIEGSGDTRTAIRRDQGWATVSH
jgi:acetolactate synthase-1/2/3 large subunit